MGKISYLRTLLVAVAAFAFVACSDDKNGNDLPDGGVTEKDCSNTKSVTGGAGSFKITFTAVGDWEAVSSDDSWLTIVPADGGKGSNKITVSFTQNTAATSRRGTVAIRVSGYRDAVLCTLTQSGAGSGSDTAVNEWIEEYMKEAYLWNEAIDQVALDNTVSFKEYLKSILDGVAAQKDASGRPVNYDDGYWENGVRQEYYSYIELNEQSRSTRAGETYNDTGILNVISGYLQEEPYIGGLVIMGVAPGSSADEAGLKRGHMVTEVDGVKYTKNLSADVKQNMFLKLVQGNNVRIVANEVSGGDNGDWVLTPLPEMTLSSFSYVDPAIYKQDVVDIDGRKVAYLLYMGFSRAYDEDLFEAFDRFKAEGAEELVLDLRYNGGGEVLSSTLLATLIAGQEYKGQVYVKTTYNASRTAAGQTGALYKIGESVVSGSDSSYSLIAEALNHSLGLKRIYVICSVNTASASELIINGLRGMGIEVRLIGTQTQGKNVGMEGYVNRKVGNLYYDFLPITFYSENAVGFKDYSDGFTPDVIFDDANYYPGDFGTLDDGLFARAASWISTGEKPGAASSLRKSRSMVVKQRYRADFPQRHPVGSLVLLDEQ